MPKNVKLTDLEIKIVRLLQQELPLVADLYGTLAAEIGITEDELLAEIKSMQGKGYLKRLSVALRHKKVGYTTNVLMVWDVDGEKVTEIGQKLAAHPRVTHCYERVRDQEFDYNLYSMIHAMSETEYEEILSELINIVEPKKFYLLRTEREVKKVGMKYFLED